MILKNCQAGYQAASNGILVSNYLAKIVVEKVEVLTRQQPCIFHVFRIKTTKNDIFFCTAPVHFGQTISCLKTDVWFILFHINILFHIKREEINSGQINTEKQNPHFQSGLTNNTFSK